MIRRKSPRTPVRKRINIPRDTTKLLIAYYLYRKGAGATPNELARKATSRTQAADIFKVYLEEMLEMKWVTKKKHRLAGGISEYNITEHGIKAIEHARELIDNDHPLSKLDAFGIE